METVFLSRAKAQSSLIDLTRICTSMEWAVAWATPNALVDEAFKHRAKFTRFVIGTHLYQTQPEVLTRFAPVPSVRVVPPTGALFHPKVYVFVIGDLVTAIVGSHNLTDSAMNRNVEASMLFQGTSSDPALVDLRKFVAQAWSDGQVPDPDFLYRYASQYKVKAKAREALTEFVEFPLPRKAGTKRAPHEMSWADYVAEVTKPRKDTLADRLTVLAGVRQLFEAHPSFASMSDDERKLVAGTSGKVKSLQDGTDYALFGSMGGSGSFAKIVGKSPAGLSHALAAIPATGTVSDADYDKYVARFADAFVKAKAARVGRLPTATRLLAMKRPDVFVCVDKQNKRDLCEHFGVAPSTTDLDNYWERIIFPMRQTQWWLAPAPSDPLEAQIWNGRAALLDAIYYQR